MWCEQSRAEQGQGKEEDDKASDTFPFHRQQGSSRGDKAAGKQRGRDGRVSFHFRRRGQLELSSREAGERQRRVRCGKGFYWQVLPLKGRQGGDDYARKGTWGECSNKYR